IGMGLSSLLVVLNALRLVHPEPAGLQADDLSAPAGERSNLNPARLPGSSAMEGSRPPSAQLKDVEEGDQPACAYRQQQGLDYGLLQNRGERSDPQSFHLG